jgi:hypothetical protein
MGKYNIFRAWYYPVSGIHWGPWNVSPKYKGALLYLDFRSYFKVYPG